MRVNKFNENKKWSKEAIKHFLDEEERIRKEKKQLLFLFKQYLELNPKFLPDDLRELVEKGDWHFTVTDVEILSTDIINVEVSWYDDEVFDTISFTDDQLDDVFYFINNIEMYKNARKYNL